MEQGGTLYISVGDFLQIAYLKEFGIQVSDICYPLDEGAFSFNKIAMTTRSQDRSRLVLDETGLQVHARFKDGVAAFVSRKIGKGRFFFMNVAFEKGMNVPYLFHKPCPNHAVYDFLAREAGVKKDLDCDDPEIEIERLEDGRAILVNHSARAKTLSVKGIAKKVVLSPFDVKVC